MEKSHRRHLLEKLLYEKNIRSCGIIDTSHCIRKLAQSEKKEPPPPPPKPKDEIVKFDTAKNCKR